MVIRTEAVFENGVFRPIDPVPVQPHRRVLLEIVELPTVQPVEANADDFNERLAKLRALANALPGAGGKLDDSRETIYAGRGE